MGEDTEDEEKEDTSFMPDFKKPDKDKIKKSPAFFLAPDIEKLAKDLKEALPEKVPNGLGDVDLNQIAFLKSENNVKKFSKEIANIEYVRNITLEKLKVALGGIKPKFKYYIEAKKERFDHLDEDKKRKYILHELMHIIPSKEALRSHDEFSNMQEMYEKALDKLKNRQAVLARIKKKVTTEEEK